MKSRVEKMRRRSFPVVSWFFTLLLASIVASVGVKMVDEFDRDGLGVMAVCLITIAIIRRIMGSRIDLAESEIRVVNPLVTHVIPLRSLRSVVGGGGLTVTTMDGGEITSTAFGGSVVDHFVGTAERAAERISARMQRAPRKGGFAPAVKRYTTAWIADACVLGAVACAVLAVFSG